MNKTLRKLTFLLCVVALLVSTLVLSAGAETKNKITADGITISLDIPKDSYAQNEELEAIVSVENFSQYSLNTVRVELIVPEGLHLVSGSQVKTYSVMTAGSTNRNTVKLAADPVEAGSDMTWLVIGGAGVAVAAAAVGVFFFLKGKKFAKTAMLLLVLALALTLLPQPAKAANEQTQVEVVETVTVGGKEYEVKAVITYTVNTFATAETIETVYVPREETTRKELEDALVEVAWDYYLKKGYYQYGSMELTTRGAVGVSSPLAKDYGGTWRTNTFSDMEDATADSLILSVCSDYCFNVYDEALEYPVLGNRINAVTIGMFRLSEQCGDGSMVVMRWYDSGVSQVTASNWKTYGNTDKYDVTAEEAVEFFRNWEETMRPGDILVARGNGGHQHAMLYVGKGRILHCGGGKFDMDTFVDKTEPDGAVHYATVDGTYINGSDQKGYFKIDGTIADENKNGAWLIVLRPLNLLTLDDGDDDPSNDKLDVDYVLDVGQLKTELANNDNHPTKTSGYGISDATWTRLQYPGMNIDRTVNISLHKTATSGELLTYRIAITNNSNESYYAAYHTDGRDTFYMGQGYVNLPVSETVPEYTEFVRASNGGEIDENGVIRWNINVPVGETVTLSYTVKVTGQPGDRIINDGGFVGNIPSNSITTIVGGQKLSSYTQMIMQNFFAAGASAWNSNDGYKISADPEKDTQFVERIYEELVGVKLELPSIEVIKDIFFTQEKYYQPHGLHINHNTSLTRYMYTLNDRDEVPEEYRYVWDMLVEGYYGGVWVYSNDYNDEPRITELRYDYLEVGDIIINIRIKDSFSGGLEYEEREITAWQIQVYLGNGRFASMDYKGKFRTTSGSIALNPSFGQDFFVCLRPTQEYTNIYEDLPAYEGPAADLTEKDKMNVFIFEPSDVLLNEEGIARLQKLNAKFVLAQDSQPVNLGFADAIYTAIGLDVETNGLEDYTYAGVVKACFEDDSNSSDSLVDTYEHLYTLAAAPTEGGDALYKMLMYYGGPIYKNPNELTSLDQLYPGDILLMGRRSVSAYLCAVYQGDGRFMVATQMKEEVTSGNQIKEWFDKKISSDEELVQWLAEPINGEVTEFYLYEGYLTLRPSRAFDDINSMILRDISTGKLTKEEQEVIANLDLDDWLNAKRPQILPKFPVWAYKEAHIDLGNYFTENLTVTRAWVGTFKKDVEYGYYVPMKKGDSGYNAEIADMLVDDLYGGKYIAVKDRKILSYSDLKVGDIVCATRKNDGTYSEASNYIYWTALYQGGNQFLITETPSSGTGKAFIATNVIFGHDMSEEWIYYFVLRPQQLADGVQQPKSHVDRDIATGELTSAEKNAIANFTTDKKAQLEAFAGNVYGNANIDVTQYLTLNVNNTRKELFTDSGLLIAGDSNFHKMLVPGYYGGAKNAASAIPTNKTFTPEDFQIGDIFCGFMNNKCCDSWQNVIGIYQGNGKFLVSKMGCNTHGGLYKDISGKTTKVGSIWASLEDMNSAYMYYYVLRPQRLAGEHLLNVALSQTEAKVSVGDEFTLTYTLIPETITVESVTWESSDTSVVTVDENGKVTAVGEGEAVITLTCDGLTAQCGIKVYARNIEDGRLTAEEQTIIAGYDADKAGMWYAFVNPAYEAAGIYVEAFDTTIGFNDLRKAVLATTASDYTKMLVAGYTGGSKMTTESRTFVPADLKVGDIIATATAKCEHGSWTYLTGLYVGDGKFLVSKRTCTEEGCSTVYVDEYGVELTNGMTSFWSEAADLKAAFEYYFVLRPQQLATRNITSGALTAEEMAIIAGYDADKAALWYAFVAPAYNAAGIEVDAFNTNIGFNDLRKAVLATTASDYTKMLMPGYTGGSKMTESRTFVPADLKIGDIIASATAKCANGSWTYLTGIYVGDGKFLVAKRCCNDTTCATVYVDEYGVALTNGMTSFWSDAAALNSAYEYYFVLRPERLAAGAVEGISLNKTEITLEIGNEETLVATPAEGVVWTSSNTAVATVDENGKITAVSAGTATITANCDGYTATCVVTVNAETRNITTGALTAEEMAIIAGYDADKAAMWYAFVAPAYKAAGIEVDAFDTNIGFNDLRKAVLGATESDYTKMLMPGYTGGSKMTESRTFVPADLKIGDIIASATAKCANGSWTYLTGLYVGDGKFLVSKRCCNDTTCATVYVDEYGVELTNGMTSYWSDATALDVAYEYCFVLRPERLAADAVNGISLNKTEITMEIGDEETLVATPAATIWTSSNTAVATVDENGKITAVAAGTATITANCDGYTATCVVTVNAAPRNITTGALTAEEMAIIAGYDVDKEALWYAFVAPAYKAAGIEVDAFDTNIGFNDLRKAVLGATESDYTKMLMPGYTGGSKMTESRTFVPADLKIGDIIASATAKCAHGSWTYLTGIYVGEGKFLVSKRTCNTEGCAEVYIDEYGVALTNGMTSYWSDATALDVAYEYYFVLRPERLAADAIQSVSLDKATASVEVGSNVALTVVKNPTTAVDAATTTWTSSNTSVATVDNTGKITGVAAGTATITVNCDGYTATCEVTVTAVESSETREITTGALTAEEMLALQNYVPENTGSISPFMKNAYAAANIDLAPAVGTDSWFTIRNALFDATGNVIAGTSNFHKMLMEGYYGGKDSGSARTFTPADFKIGDIFAGAHDAGCTASGSAKKWVYITGLYIGDGKFLVSESHSTNCPDGCSKIYVDIYGDANDVIWANEDYMKTTYKFYFVLRPERLAADAIQSVSLDKATASVEVGSNVTLAVAKNPTTAVDAATTTWTSSNTSVATVDNTGKVTGVAAGTATITVNCDGYTASCVVTVTAVESSEPREITSGALTEAEITAIKNFVPEEAFTAGVFIKKAYEAANIDLTPVVGTDSFFNMQGKLFDATSGLPLETQDATYAKMLLPGCFGGKRYSNNAGVDGKTFVPADFKVGDVFVAAQDAACATQGNRWVYMTGVYIGDGKFVIAENHSHTDGADCNRVYTSDYNVENAEKSVVWGDAAAMKLYRYYFVLRPERLAADAIQSVSLDKATASVGAGSNVTLTVVKNPTTAVDAATTTWTSSNTSVATVDNTGKVTGVAEGTATITVNCDGYTASCKVTVTAAVSGEPREITEGVLTEAEITAIKNFVPEEAYTAGVFIKKAYEAANIDLTPVVGTDSFFNMQGKLFDATSGLPLATQDATYAKMLLPGCFGGKRYSNNAGVDGKTFVPADFKVGDVFVAAQDAACATQGNRWVYMTGVYIGDGKFVIAENHSHTDGEDCNRVYTSDYNVENAEKSVVWGDAAAMKLYRYYFVLRPEQLAVVEEAVSLDYTELSLAAGISRTLTVVNATGTVTWTSSDAAVATVDENGKVTAVAAGDATITASCDGKEVTCAVKVLGAAREMASGVLTAGEKATISTAGTDIFTTYTTGPAISVVYAEAGVDANAVYGKIGAGDVFKVIKGTNENATVLGTYVVDAYYGSESITKETKTFVPADFEVGDILVANYKCTHNKWPTITAIYQDNGKFLVVRQPGSSGCTCNKEAHFDIYDAAGNHDAAGHVSIWSTAKDAANTEGGAWLNYAILRPSQLAD